MLLQALTEFYKRAPIDNPAFNTKYIRWIIPLNSEGELAAPGLIENDKKEGRKFKVPTTTRPKNAGGVAEFLWEGIEAIFNLDPKPNETSTLTISRQEKAAKNRRAKYEDFWNQIEIALQKTHSPFLSALLNFKRKYTDCVPPFLVLKREENKTSEEWFVSPSDASKERKFDDDNFTFQVDGKLILDDKELQDYWTECYESECQKTNEENEKGVCLITGQENVPISSSHLPKIQGVPGSSPTGSALISFDKSSFKSYGFEQSLNAPVSTSAVTAYCKGLNYLLSQKTHSFRLANTVICFWAKEIEKATDIFGKLFDNPTLDNIRNFLKSPFSGSDDSVYAVQNDMFYSVTLSGNSGRVIVRHWMQMTIDQAVNNFRRWFEDLNVVTIYNADSEEDRALSIYNLATTTLREDERDTKKLKSEHVTQLYRAALEGTAPSLILAQSILQRFNKDLAKDGKKALNNLSRFALLKLILNRNRKGDEPVIKPELTIDTDDPAYNCGRLLAVFEDLQHAAHDYKLEGATVVEKYYGSASSSPNSAFGILWRLHQHHLKKLSRDNKAKAEAIKNKIAEIACKFKQEAPNSPPKFPRSFDLHAQGRFALGFYQQIAFDRAARKAYLDAAKSDSALDTQHSEGAVTHE